MITIVSTLWACSYSPEPYGQPILYKKIAVPESMLTNSHGLTYGGDIRIGDLTNDGSADFLLYRAAEGDPNGATKPCFIGAFTIDGEVLWQTGAGGVQPYRPGPVAIHDIDNDGESEVICFFTVDSLDHNPFSLQGISIQIRDGKTGEVELSTKLPEFGELTGKGPNWVHQRIFLANFRGLSYAGDFVVKLGKTMYAFDQELNILWTYFNPNDQYQNCPAYIPAVGDIDYDGKDEVNGGYYLIDDDGSVMWEQKLGKNMDAVTITEWDNGIRRAFGSGFGHILDKEGNIILKLGEEIVPHGQEMQVADFDPTHPGPEMIIRYNGHNPDAILVDNHGKVINRFSLNQSPNNTGMTTVYWAGQDQPALLFNGGVLWHGWGEEFAVLPGLPAPVGDQKMGWYHCIPADVAGDYKEEVITYNPWSPYVFVYSASEVDPHAYQGYHPGPNNVRLMD